MKFSSKLVRLSALVLASALLMFWTGCGDTFRPIAAPLPTPGGDPLGADSLTIVNCNGTTSRVGPAPVCTGTARSTSLLINVSGDSLSAAGDLGVAPGAITFSPARNGFYVPNTTSDAVTSIQYSTTQVGASALFVANAATLTLPTGSNPVATVFGTSEAYILNAGSGAICPNFSVIAIATNAVSNTLCIGSAPTYGVQTGNNVFILDKVLNQVNVYSTQQQKFIASIPVGTTPVFATLSFDGNFVYVVNQGSSDISIIDANALTVVSTVASGGSGPITAFLDRSLVRLYVLNQANTTVASFNALGNSTLVPLGAATVGPNPVNLTVLQGGNRAFTANFGNNTLTEINTGSFTTKTITIGTDPSALVTDVASSSDGSKLYAASVTSGNFINGVTVIRTSDEVVVNTLLAPKQDSNCVTTTASPCALQQPQQFLGGR
jgi:YVTN family beta-propeller protein